MRSLSARERAALAASGAELALVDAVDLTHFSPRTLKRGRADLRRRYGARTFPEALRRHQMSVDEGTARLDRLERMLEGVVTKIDKLGQNGSSASVDRDIRRIEDEFTPEELQAVRDQRDFEKFKRYADRYADELEREALAADADTDTEDEDEDEDEDADEGDGAVRDDAAGGKPKPRAKPKPKPKRKPASRHDHDDGGDADDEGDGDKPGFLSKFMSD